MQLSELERLFARYGLRDEFRRQEALFLWPQVAGERISRLCSAQHVSGGVLYVQVANHVYAQELTALRETYLERLNARLQEPLSEIRFRVASVSAPPPPKPPLPSTEGVALDEAERGEAEGAADSVQDPKLRGAFARYFATLRRLEKLKAEHTDERRCPVCGLHHDGPEARCAFCRLEGREA